MGVGVWVGVRVCVCACVRVMSHGIYVYIYIYIYIYNVCVCVCVCHTQVLSFALLASGSPPTADTKKAPVAMTQAKMADMKAHVLV